MKSLMLEDNTTYTSNEIINEREISSDVRAGDDIVLIYLSNDFLMVI